MAVNRLMRVWDADDRLLRVGQLVTVVDFRGDPDSDGIGWNRTMAGEIGKVHLIEDFELSSSDEPVVRLVDMSYIWYGRWLRGQQAGLKHLVERYQNEVDHAG